MIDPRIHAEQLLGAIEWQNEVSGYCRCPGQKLHTTANEKRDCRVNLDGAPSIFCFHASCRDVVREANQRLRRVLGAEQWEIVLAGGRVLRSGDIVESTGKIVRREVLVNGARTLEQRAEKVVVESVRVMAERFSAELFERFYWPMEAMLRQTPLKVCEREAEDQFRTWLKLWPAHARVWIGDVYSSGRPEHRTHFRPVSEWYQIGPVLGNFTCGASFKRDCYRRCNENIDGHRFLVVESDTLGKDDVGAVFSYMQRRLKYRLHCIVDTAGKSLHGWFDAPRNKILEDRLKAGLAVFGCDPNMFNYSQPVRVPGAWRDGKLQRLIWLEA